jgi:hypothetical protein
MVFDPDYDWHDDYEAEFSRKRRPFRCSDGMCGQLDCERCYPQTEGKEDE